MNTYSIWTDSHIDDMLRGTFCTIINAKNNS